MAGEIILEILRSRPLLGQIWKDQGLGGQVSPIKTDSDYAREVSAVLGPGHQAAARIVYRSPEPEPRPSWSLIDETISALAKENQELLEERFAAIPQKSPIACFG